ncbi:MAG: thiamine-binding protein [Deltaproteobacteria bacterium]|nr:thiamine-binding protein [Deltaproteobacteria bacterium]
MKRMHMRMREKSKRVSTFIKIDDKVGKTGTLKKKVESVRAKLD